MPNTTIYTLAKELNMTPTMVSRAFNPDAKISEEKRAIVLAAAKRHNFSPNRFASRLSMKTVKIAILINSNFSVNEDNMLAGIETAYRELKDYKVTYDIKIMHAAENDIESYHRELSKYKKYDGIILTGMSSNKYTGIINELYAENPNIVQVQAINENANYLFGSKHDEKTASNLAADFLYNCLRRAGRKNVILFTGDTESALHASARAAFEAACENLGISVIESVDMKDSEEYFTGILPGVFEKHSGEVDGIYITSGFSAPLCKYLEENKIDVPYVAFDTYEEIKKYIERGIISATIDQNVPRQMAAAFELLVKYLITGEKPEKAVYTDIQILLKSNIHQA
ncbi:MAG: LacI family DNA-binding transcriptional regulator [Oscillospiraceae bacterium]|nr:LacI family DNA-binding transcriptional regulator [Oscillospiraceae bacterium]